MADGKAPYHAHIYYDAEQRPAAEALRNLFVSRTHAADQPHIIFVGDFRDYPQGPHPLPQYEIHFLEAALPSVKSEIEAAGLRALVHPLTQDDLADHTSLAQWLGPPLNLDLTVLDPPGQNKGVPRFGKY
jgi:aromatic ring-cleaving dioxygenase